MTGRCISRIGSLARGLALRRGGEAGSRGPRLSGSPPHAGASRLGYAARMDESAAIDAYIAGLAEPHRSMLSEVRETIRDACPDAVEAISYKMPAFRLNGRLFIWYAGYKGHCAVYPASAMAMDALGDELSPFVTEKATIRFTAKKPLPADLLRRIVAVRVEETAAATSD